MHQLRGYQKEIIAEIEAAIAQGYRRIMLQLPTGAGKTRCFVELAKRHRAKPYAGNISNCLIVAHRQELIKQAVNALESEMGSRWEIGIIKSQVEGHPYRAIQVASIQTLIKRVFPKAGLVIIDEAHHATADIYQRVIHHPRYEEAVILGVTATPERTDGRGFRDSFDILIKSPTVRELTVQRYLCPYKLYAYTRDRIDTSYVKTQAGDYQLNQLAEAVMDSEVRADLVKTWQKQALGKRTVVFAVNVQLSKDYAALYNESSGYRAEHIDGKTHKDEREAILERFKNGTTTILCNCNIVTEGFDLPEMECVQIVRPTQSRSFWLQMVGRSLRISEGKTHAIILDHTDNYKRLGLPDREYDWSLDSRIRPPKFIPDNPVGNSLRGEREPREIEHLEGELVEIYSNSQELENTDMVKIRIDKVEYEATSSLADVICKILDRIDEVEDLLIEKEEELDAALGRADGYEEAIEEIAQELKQLRNDAKKIDALKLSITELTEKLKLAEAALEEKEEQLDAAVGRADGYEEAINEIIDELNQLREDAKAMADEDDEREKQLEAAIGRADGYEEAIKSISAELNQLRKEAKKMADDEEDEDIPKSKKKKGFVTFKKGEKMDSDTIAEVLQRPEVQEFIGEFLEDEIDSRLDAFARASELLEAYGISLEDAGITTRMDSITTIRTAITKLNPKNDISDRSDEYVINRFDTYCEIVAERVEYEKSISK